MVREKRQKFRYQPRGVDAWKKRANQSGGMYDSYFRSDFQVFSSAKEGDYCFRILPPTWKKPDHFGLEIWVHYGVGSDNQTYLCLESMKGEPCPICENRVLADKAGDSEYAKTLSPTKRVVVWMVDRNDENSGPQIWAMPWTLDRDYASLSLDKRSQARLNLDDPEEGYDLEFIKKGQKRNVKYIGVQVARRESPLSDDEELMGEWLRYVQENPIPETLQYYEYDHIKAIDSGGKRRDDTDDDDDDDDDDRGGKKKSKSRKRDDDDDAPLDDDEDDEDEDGLPPRRRKTRSGKDDKKRRERMRDDDDEDDDDDDDEDDDAPPKKKKGSASRSRPARKRDDDEDDDDDDEDED